MAHSLSPTLHNAAFAALGLDWVYVAFPVPRGRGADAVAAVPALGLAGLNVTMPHKEDVAARLRRAAPPTPPPSGRSTPWWPARTAAPSATRPTAPASSTPWPTRRSPSAGSPSSCSAPAAPPGPSSWPSAGPAPTVTVAARRPDAAEAAAALAPGARALPLGAVDPSRLHGGGQRHARSACPAATPSRSTRRPLHADQAVVDLVYHPADTPLLTAARAQGALAVNGLGMLLHQAARSFTLWTGQPAPLEPCGRR